MIMITWAWRWVLPTTTHEDSLLMRKKGNASITLLCNVVPKDHHRRFSGMDAAKGDLGQPSRHDFGGNGNSKGNLPKEASAGYSFVRKPCFVCGSLSHLIKDCDYYEKKMAREVALKSKMVIHVDARKARPAWTNTNSSGSKHVNAGSVHFNSGTQFKSGASRFNTGKQHVNSGRMYVNSGTQNKSGGSRS
ncbi:hypothetical protein Tco_0138590 [Tanacetum coccineum]